MVSRLWVLLITRGLALFSDWEELDEARGRRLQNITALLVKRISVISTALGKFAAS